MRRFQKLRSSATLLIIAILAVMCFTRGTLQVVLYGISFAVWSVYAIKIFVMPAIERYRYRQEVKQGMCVRENKFANTMENSKLSHLLLCHVNHRITGHIKSIYPDATWAWKINNPAYIMANSGIGRIELFGVKDYNYADITFDNDANIEFSLLKVTSMKTASQIENKDSTVDEPKSDIDPQVWFDTSGSVVLKSLIADLNSRGHNTLTIQEDGSCIIKQGDKDLKVKTLDAFPQKVYYPRLIKVLAGAGIAAKSVDAGLAVSW